MKRALITRLGAWGDMIIITGVIREIKKLGYYIILNTTFRGEDIFKHNPNIDEFIHHDEKMMIDKVEDHWKKLQEEIPHDLYINFSESIECNVALHPKNPEYVYPKQERALLCDKNYYDVSAKWAADRMEEPQVWMYEARKPELFFTQEEEEAANKHLKKDKFNILWCLSGSGSNKAYPWTDYVIGECLKESKDYHFITVGNEKCQLLEDIGGMFPKENITPLSGKIGIRESMAITKFCDLVVSPDTGMLHASGCYDTPKIGLLGHTSIENITKYFKNDYSVCSKADCAPCFRLIYDYSVQCPVDPSTKAAYCMASIDPKEVYENIKLVRDKFNKKVL